MPSIGHAIVGLAAARAYAPEPRLPWRTGFTFMALALAPDLDLPIHRLVAATGAATLHRGPSHSLTVALGLGLAAAALGGQGRSRAAAWMAGALTAATHGLLDTLTHGGAGIMLLWPWSAVRVHAPVALLPAAPLGLRLLSSRGLAVAAWELLLFSPLLGYLAWRWRRPARNAGDHRA